LYRINSLTRIAFRERTGEGVEEMREKRPRA
jgi:hypothetical protein